MIHSEPLHTPAGCRRAPTKETLVQWLVKDAIPSALTERSFKKCSILNNLDGTVDDIMFKDVCPVRVAMVSDADDLDPDMDMWDDAAMVVLAAFFDSDDESDFEGF